MEGSVASHMQYRYMTPIPISLDSIEGLMKF